jgi:haloalkane dehalogenase
MAAIEQRRAGSIAYREAMPDGAAGGAPVLLLHGFPESSRMWEPAMSALADAGRRCLAPDLYGLGDSAGQEQATFESNLDGLAGFCEALGLERVALVVHDWGAFVGLAWACERPERIEALVISAAGFFSDGKWHGMAKAVRGEQGEELVAAITREGFATMMAAAGARFDEADLDAYGAPFADGRGQRATLDFYRSMDFEKLEPYQGRLGELGVPTLLLWGADDEFAPPAGAQRFAREIPGSTLIMIEGAGHFVIDEQPERCASELVGFLTALRG